MLSICFMSVIISLEAKASTTSADVTGFFADVFGGILITIFFGISSEDNAIIYACVNVPLKSKLAF
jgi:hypothetical protein